MTFTSSASSSSASIFSAGPSSSTSRSPSVEPSSFKKRRLTLDDIHIPAGFEIAKNLGEQGTEYPSEDNIQKVAEVLQSLRGRMPDGSDGQVAACDYCRRRKIRCDRNKPTCGSCISSGRKCITEDMLRKRGPPSKKERAILEAAGIIFRGTRPHRRRRTATTSLGSGVSKKQQEVLVRKVKEAAGTRTRANSDNSGDNSAVVSAFAELDGTSKSSWMEALSIATHSANPFADSPASSPSDISAQDTFHIDADACDYILPGVAPVPARTAMGNLHNNMMNPSSAGWENMWASFGNDLRDKYTGSTSGFNSGMNLPNLTAFACNADMDTKEGLLRSSPLASFDAGALDWSSSNLSPSQYQMLFPNSRQEPSTIPVVHMDPNIINPAHATSSPQELQPQSQPQPSLSSQSGMAAEAIAFQAAMGHFFPKNHATSNSCGSSAASADVTTPTELDQFISMGEQHQQQQHLHQQQQQQPQHELPSSLAF